MNTKSLIGIAAVLTTTMSLLVVAMAAAPLYDRQLAVELARAYVRADFRKKPDMALPGVDYRHPVVVAAFAAKGRAYVFVSFSSTKPNWGAYVTFQVCKSTPSLVPADSGTVDNISSLRADNAKVGPQVYVALDDVCPKPES